MKSFFIKFVSILLISCFFFACSSPAEDEPESGNNGQTQIDSQSGNNKTESGKNTKDDTQKDTEQKDTEQKDDITPIDDETENPKQNKHYGVTFDFEGAQAIAKLESENSRAAASARNLGDLVKIKSDGSMENAIIVEEDCSLSDIVSIYKSPDEESKEIFLVLNGESTLGHEEVEKQYEWGETYKENQDIRVGQLIGLKEDGSIADILKKENATDYMSNHMSLKTDSITFDAKGNIYFISSDNGDMIYQYNPKTNELTKMVAAVEGTNYEKMKIDDEGQWIFVSGSRYTGSSSYFLRAIPISNPNGFVNVFYSSNESIYSNGWVYDDKNGKLFFIVNDGNKSGLFTTTKTGGFRDKTYLRNSVGTGFVSPNLFESYGFYTGTYYWNDAAKDTQGKYDPQKIIDRLLGLFPTYWDASSGQEKRITLNEVDIRFDKYENLNGELCKVAKLTKGKKNLEALEALDTNEGRGALYAISCHNDGYFDSANAEEGYSHNLLADIIYLKGTDVLLADYEEELFNYTVSFDPVYNEETGEWNYPIETRSIKGCDLFEKYLNGNYKNSHAWVMNMDFVGGTDYWRNCYRFSPNYYKENNKIDANLVLEKLFSYCNINGKKELRLTAFKDDEYYCSLYTTLTDVDAIEWIESDLERMNLFGQLLGMPTTEYFAFMRALSQVCYIFDTNQKSLAWNCNDYISIEYSQYCWEGSGNKLTTTDNGIYYEYYNTTGTDPYYYIVQISDSNGELVELVNKLPLPSGKVVKSEKNKDRILLQYSVMDENGAELGYHHIYSVEMANGQVTNCFDNVPNRNSLEVVSFNSAGDLLYYSAVRGTSVENGIVNIVTNEYNPLTVQRKMVAVYTFN